MNKTSRLTPDTLASGLPAGAERNFTSIDRSSSVVGYICQPDRYRDLLSVGKHGPIIPRGSGLSYVAASMGEGVTSISMTRFSRLLAFDPDGLTVKVEAGIPVGTLCTFLLAKKFMLPVVPGHPAITVGGCIACNVHGKNHAREGAFGDHVCAITLWTPEKGLCQIGHGDLAFDATLGGLGLTGIIVSAELAIVPFPYDSARMTLHPVEDLIEGQSLLCDLAGNCDLLYSWHNFSRGRRGPGFVLEGNFECQGEIAVGSFQVDGQALQRKGFGRWLNRTTIPLVNTFYRMRLTGRHGSIVNLGEALFPLAQLSFYFRLYGRKGMREQQVLIPHAKWQEYVQKFIKLREAEDVDIVVASLKVFGLEGRLLSFTGHGMSLTIDMPNTEKTLRFLEKLDSITTEMGGRTNSAKDSRLSAKTFQEQISDIDTFREVRASLDPKKQIRSEVSMRLEL